MRPFFTKTFLRVKKIFLNVQIECALARPLAVLGCALARLLAVLGFGLGDETKTK